jgi:beta-galactosidase
LHRTPLFVRKAGLGLYFYRVPSLPATDDGSAKPLAEDLDTRLGSEEDIRWDAGAEPGATEADVAVSATEPDAKARPAQADDSGPHPAEADPEAVQAKAEAAPPASGRWFRRTEPDAMLAGMPALAGMTTETSTAQVQASTAVPTADSPPAPETGPAAPPWASSRPAKPAGTPRPAGTVSSGLPVRERGAALVGSPILWKEAEPPRGRTRTVPSAAPGDGDAGAPGDGDTGRPGDGDTGRPGDGAGTGTGGGPGDGDGGAGGTGGDAADGTETAARRRISRRTVLQASLLGGAGVAALPLLALVGGATHEQPVGATYSMNSNWLFGGQYMAGSESSAYDDGGFAAISLPHTVTSLSWRNWDYDAWQQVWIYRRHFSGTHLVGSDHPGNRIFIDFDGVMVNASVVVNDQVVSTHQGGYLPWSAELTGKITSGDNLLAVIVDSRCLPVPPVGVGRGPYSIDFFQPGGIYRDVSLRVVPPAFISDLFALPADVLTPQRRVDVEATIDSAVAPHGDGTLLVELFDGSSQIAAQVTTLRLTSPGTSTAKLSLTDLGPVGLWSPDSPKLYEVRATLSFPGVKKHVLTKQIGFRDASFRPEGFFLNGERLQIFGLNRHQLYPYAGMAMPARVQRKDAEILKNDLNCNMVRCSHYPQSAHFLDACDELGLLVWEEAPGWHAVSTSPAWQDLVVQNVRDMVTRDRSRPSVVIWGTRLNETSDFPGLWAATRQAARELDSSRPSSGAMAFHQDITWNEDVYAYNDYGVNPKTGNPILKPPFAGLPYLVTETVGVEEARPQHFAWTDSPAQLTRQAELHGQAQNLARSNTGYSGMLAWAGFDYASLFGQDPDAIKWAGVADGFRIPKPGAAIYQSQSDPGVTPVILPVFFWQQGGAVPAAPPTMIASNCEQLEIFLDGVHATTALPALDSPLYSGLIHPPFLFHFPPIRPNALPELLVLGFVGGQQVAHLRMSADPAGDTLGMTVDDTSITADGSDMTRVVFRAIDAYGNQRRYASGQVTLSLSGPGTLVGDNPFAFGEYGGLGAVWIRSQAGQPGTIALTASHPLLGQAEIHVRSSPADQANQLA